MGRSVKGQSGLQKTGGQELINSPGMLSQCQGTDIEIRKGQGPPRAPLEGRLSSFTTSLSYLSCRQQKVLTVIQILLGENSAQQKRKTN
jgi:hypothetical protein